MPDIFLSYNREDQATARRFAEAFAAEGLDVWWDVALRSGEAYDEVTETALRTARAVVVLWSPRSVVSRWVRAEATLADRNRTLLPVTIEPCERPIMFELTQTADLCHWGGDLGDRAWQALVADVRRLCARAVEAGGEAPAAPTPGPAGPRRGQRGSAPSIAILPFTNRSGLAEDEVFAFGMVEDIIDAMSQGVDVRVVASSATARFRNGPVPDLHGMARELGVRYVLEGNVRRMGEHLRVTTQLIEPARGDIVWTQKFDRPLAQLAHLQEELVLEVAAKLRVQSHRLEIERALRKPGDLTAWEAVMRAIAAYRHMTGAALIQGLMEARRAVEIDPSYGLALALVAQAEGMIYNQVIPDNPTERGRIRALVDQAIAADPDNPVVLSTAAGALCNLGFGEEALAAARRSIARNPGNEWGQLACGWACALLGRSDEAIAHFDKEYEIAPDHPMIWTSHLWRACAHIKAGRWPEALATYDAALALTPDNAAPNHGRAVAARQLGRPDEARAYFARARQCEPETPLATWEMRFSRAWQGDATHDIFLDHLRALWAEHEAAAEPSTVGAEG